MLKIFFFIVTDNLSKINYIFAKISKVFDYNKKNTTFVFKFQYKREMAEFVLPDKSRI